YDAAGTWGDAAATPDLGRRRRRLLSERARGLSLAPGATARAPCLLRSRDDRARGQSEHLRRPLRPFRRRPARRGERLGRGSAPGRGDEFGRFLRGATHRRTARSAFADADHRAFRGCLGAYVDSGRWRVAVGGTSQWTVGRRAAYAAESFP